jgi:hypothetical protein
LVANLAKAPTFSGVLLQLFAGFAGLALVELGMIFSRAGDPWISSILAIFGVTLAMIGPRAWSVDARLFGRKHIEISEP